MGDEQSDTNFQKQKNTQNLNEKSSVLKFLPFIIDIFLLERLKK